MTHIVFVLAMDKHSGTSLPANTLPTSLQGILDECNFIEEASLIELSHKLLKSVVGSFRLAQ